MLSHSGLIVADRLNDLLHITRAELAVALGLLRDVVSKSTRAGSPQQAFAWYRSQPLPSFGDQTAKLLVRKDGQRQSNTISTGSRVAATLENDGVCLSCAQPTLVVRAKFWTALPAMAAGSTP